MTDIYLAIFVILGFGVIYASKRIKRINEEALEEETQFWNKLD